MANTISSVQDFQSLVIKQKKPVMVIFFDNNSPMKRVKAYENIIDTKYSTVLSYNLNCDSVTLSKEDYAKYVAADLICCSGIVGDSVRCLSVPNETGLTQLLDWLVKGNPPTKKVGP
jgi:hypothetical protein